MAEGKRQLLARCLDRTGCNRILRSLRVWRGLLVLNYHRIGDASGSFIDHDLWNATAEQFDQQIGWIAKNFETIGLDQLDQASHTSRPLVMITFDDGYTDNHQIALPILQRHGVPATFFITTGFIDQPHAPWWDEIAWMIRSSNAGGLPENEWTDGPVPFDEPARTAAVRQVLKVFKQLSGDRTEPFVEFLADATGSGRCPPDAIDGLWMNWNMVRDLRDAGMSIGAHTVTHPILTSLPVEQQRYEIAESQTRLQTELGQAVDAFSYPAGKPFAFDEQTIAILRDLGFRYGFSHYGGYMTAGRMHAFDIPRVPMDIELNLREFRAIPSLPQLFAV